MVRNFWWGHSSDERKVHWISWDKLTSPKYHGGLGFRDMNCFNQALLARQAWRLLTIPESLYARVLKAKYYPNGMLTDTSFPQVSSPSWKGIVWSGSAKEGTNLEDRRWTDNQNMATSLDRAWQQA